MSEQISYDAMRRLLGLPQAPARTPAPWAVRKIRVGDDCGQWGVWRYTGRAAPMHVLVATYDNWPDAITRIR
ncbi:hypothetical protein AB4Z09_11125 [Rhodococcus sp. TAF43]|uniref:hypothetical protein n=1 Tax=unclassified Rhodococcus (in: high G+C Gram-positive bacteria) TaxID=192944 RepID=UPI003D1D008D